jgi:formiminotetrahydrofolate cyclodeaminase
VTSPSDPDPPDYRELSVAAWLQAVAAPEPTPGGGGAAAFTAALSAALVAMAARFSRADDADEIAARADELRERVLALADEDALAYRAVLASYRLPHDTEGRRDRIKQTLRRASDVPLEIAGGAAEVAVLGADIGERGNPNLAGDAATAVHLAVAAARSAAELILINTRLGGLDPGPGERAAALVGTAESASRRLSSRAGGAWP